jgi:hypothetical protein
MSNSESNAPKAGDNPMAEFNEKKPDKTDLYGSSGIYAPHVNVPWWLQIVLIGLIVWGIYYFIRFWNF